MWQRHMCSAPLTVFLVGTHRTCVLAGGEYLESIADDCRHARLLLLLLLLLLGVLPLLLGELEWTMALLILLLGVLLLLIREL